MRNFTAELLARDGCSIPDNKQVEAMLADLAKGPFAGQKFKFQQADPATGKREVKVIGR